jgi:ribonuclease D
VIVFAKELNKFTTTLSRQSRNPINMIIKNKSLNKIMIYMDGSMRELKELNIIGGKRRDMRSRLEMRIRLISVIIGWWM